VSFFLSADDSVANGKEPAATKIYVIQSPPARCAGQRIYYRTHCAIERKRLRICRYAGTYIAVRNQPVAKTEQFFWFPLALLSLPPIEIVEWCVGDVADFKKKNMKQSAKTLGVDCHGHFDRVLSDAKGTATLLDVCSDASRKNRVRVKSEWLWACHSGELPERHFRVLCALLSKVGMKRYAKVGWREIQARAAGRCGKIDMTDPPKPLLSREQIRRTINQLESWNFFARFVYGKKGRETWVSFSMPRAELVKAVLAKKNGAAEKLSARRAMDAVRIANRPAENRQGATNPPTNPPTNINMNVFNKNVLNKNKIKEASSLRSEGVSLFNGYLIDGIFMQGEAANKLLADNPNRADEILDKAIPATRDADGNVTTSATRSVTAQALSRNE
jgi:hypothetical protein